MPLARGRSVRFGGLLHRDSFEAGSFGSRPRLLCARAAILKTARSSGGWTHDRTAPSPSEVTQPATEAAVESCRTGRPAPRRSAPADLRTLRDVGRCRRHRPVGRAVPLPVVRHLRLPLVLVGGRRGVSRVRGLVRRRAFGRAARGRGARRQHALDRGAGRRGACGQRARRREAGT